MIIYVGVCCNHLLLLLLSLQGAVQQELNTLKAAPVCDAKVLQGCAQQAYQSAQVIPRI